MLLKHWPDWETQVSSDELGIRCEQGLTEVRVCACSGQWAISRAVTCRIERTVP